MSDNTNISDILEGLIKTSEEKNISDSRAEFFNKKIWEIDLDQAFKDYNNKLDIQADLISEQQQNISDQQENINSTQENLNKALDDLKNHELQLKEQSAQLSLTNKVTFTLIVALALVTIWWIYEFYVRFSDVKFDYIKQTEETENKIELFEKDIEKMKSDIINDIESNNNDIADVEKRIEKEVELQISKKIIELKLNINN